MPKVSLHRATFASLGHSGKLRSGKTPGFGSTHLQNAASSPVFESIALRKCDVPSVISCKNMASQPRRMAGTRGQQARECEFWKESKYICTHVGTSSGRRGCIVKGIAVYLSGVHDSMMMLLPGRERNQESSCQTRGDLERLSVRERTPLAR